MVGETPTSRVFSKPYSLFSSNLRPGSMVLRYVFIIQCLLLILAFLPGQSLQYQGNFPITKGFLLMTIPKLSASYVIKFQINPTRFQSGWSSVIHFTAHGGNGETYGDRNPAVWFWSASPKDTVNKLHICSSINNNRNYIYNTPKNIRRGVWTDVEISQRLDGSAYRYTVKVNGAVLGTVINKVAKEFSNVKVFTGDNFYNNQPGYIRALTVTPQADSKL